MKDLQLPPQLPSELAWQIESLVHAAYDQICNRVADKPLPETTPIPMLLEMALDRAVLLHRELDKIEHEAAMADR